MDKKGQRPTIDDVAREAGVSIATVSRVINQTAPVTEKNVERVLSAIEILNYQPQAAARILASRKTHTIGLLLPEISNYYFFPMILGVESGAHENGYNLLIQSTFSPKNKTHEKIKLSLGAHNTDGLIFCAHSHTKSKLRYLNHLGFPMVLLHQSPPKGLLIPNVTFENKSGSRKLVEHLIEEHNYRRIVFLAGPKNHENSYWREMGYLEALEAHDLVFDPALKINGFFNAERAKHSVTQLISRNIAIDAIFAADEESASGAMMAIREAKMRIPEEIAVVGFDDTLLASHLSPPLTTVRTPIEQAGRQAVNQLIQLIEGKATDLVTLMEANLVIRQSCGCR